MVYFEDDYIKRRAKQVAKDNDLKLVDWAITADSTGWITIRVFGKPTGIGEGAPGEHVCDDLAGGDR